MSTSLSSYKSNNASSIFLLYLVVLITVVTTTPRLGFSIWLVLPLLMSVPFIVNALNKHKLYSFLSLYIFIVLLYAICGISDAGLGDYMHHVFFFIPIFLLIHLRKLFVKKRSLMVWWIMISIMTANVLINVVLAIMFPSINSKAVQELYGDEFLKSMNFGGSKFYNFAFFFYLVCLFVLMNTKEKIVKWVLLFVVILTGVYICWFCYKASVILYLLFSTITMIVAKRTKHIFKFAIISVFFGILATYYVSNNEKSVIAWIMEVSPDQRVSQRLVTIIDIDSSDANETTLTGRTELYFMSITTWLDNPRNFFFGIGDHRSMENVEKTGISQHSDLLDTLARYGLIGLITIYFVFRYSFLLIRSFYDKKYYLQLSVIFIVLIIFGLTKSIYTPAIGCTIYLLLPLSANYVNK